MQSSYRGWLILTGVVFIFLVWGLAAAWDYLVLAQETGATPPANPPHSASPLLLAVFFTVVILGAIFLNYRWPFCLRINAAFMVITSLLFASLFPMPRARIKTGQFINDVSAINDCRDNVGSGAAADKALDNDVKTLMEKEHHKAIEEIKQRVEIDDDWFHNKFILVGSLLAAFFAYLAQFISWVWRVLSRLELIYICVPIHL